MGSILNTNLPDYEENLEKNIITKVFFLSSVIRNIISTLSKAISGHQKYSPLPLNQYT
jgi:hypothetical protein